jgi:hypothetical protein
MAAAHFNQQHIGKWGEEYCAQARFCEFLGVKVPPATRAAWNKANANRTKDSVRRHTEAHKVKSAKQKKGRRERKQADARDATQHKDAYKSGGYFGQSKVAAEREGGDDEEAGSAGGKMRLCKSTNGGCGQLKYHDKSKRKCADCLENEAKAKGKGKGKAKAKAKAKAKGKRKRAASDDEGDGDDDDEEEEEEEAGVEEEDEWDAAADPQLKVAISKRLADPRLKVGSGLEVRFDTTGGFFWFDGKVKHLHGNGNVKFIEDDGTVHHYFDLKVETWKFL